MAGELIGRLPTIPEYFRLYINKNVDLTTDPKQCCPFHHEDTPSWSYSPDRRRWRCFGACKVGGDVVDLHRVNRKFDSREEALASLKALHKVVTKPKLEMAYSTLELNTPKVELESLLQKAYIMAKSPTRWLELDYVMSKWPVEQLLIEELINKWNKEREA